MVHEKEGKFRAENHASRRENNNEVSRSTSSRDEAGLCIWEELGKGNHD